MIRGVAARHFDVAIEATRGLMFDFGLGEIVDRFEEYFGRRATKLLIACVGLGIFSATVHLFRIGILSPAYELASKISPERVEFAVYHVLPQAIGVTLIAMAIIYPLGSGLGYIWINALEDRLLKKDRAKLRRSIEAEAKKIQAEVIDETIEKAEVIFEKSRQEANEHIVGEYEALIELREEVFRAANALSEGKKELRQLLELARQELADSKGETG